MRTEDKVMNNGKLQAKQEKLKSLHCPSAQSSLFSSRGSSLNTQLHSLISHSTVPNPDQSAKSSSFSYQHNCKCAIPSLQQLFIDMSTELLRQGKNVRFQAPGLSMHPAIKEGETITVAPVARFNIKRGDILLYLAGKKVVAHRVVRIKREKSGSTPHSSANFAIQSTSDSSANSSICTKTPSLAHSSFHSSTQALTHSNELRSQLIFTLRGDASATSDDPVEEQQILGKVVSVERGGRSIDLYNRKVKIIRTLRLCASHIKRWARNFFYMRLPRRCAPRNDSKIVIASD
jgi:hypothetical protein